MKQPSRLDPRSDEARSASNEKIARLRALRLSKEAADREAAELSAAAKREAAELSAAAKRAEAKSKPRTARKAKQNPESASPPHS